MDSNVKLLICYHKPATLFQDEILTPIHVGRANARKRMDADNPNLKWLMENMIGDDTGENISDRNSSYNEMTSLYWAWKNYDKLGNPDYVGLMHYRRHFVWRENETIVYNIENFNEATYLDEINYSPEKAKKMLDGCDFVTHIGKVMNVYQHYIENHKKEDLDLAVKIMLEKYPQYKDVTERYFAQDYSNFCNMFIFNKKIFFEYCEWIFDILEEFENRVDTSEKRFFISERLTGIFIANLMENKKLKYRVLPISFIEDPIRIPIAMPVNKETVFQVANTITSIMSASKGYNTYKFYLLHTDLSKEEQQEFQYFSEKDPLCQIEFMKMDIEEQYYPLYVSEVLEKENKCIYLSGNIVAMQDLGEFFRTCSTDDYYAVGTPAGKYNVLDKKKELSANILTLNCARLRKHKMWDVVKNQMKDSKSGMKLFNAFCEGETGYIPWYFVTRESEYPYKGSVLQDSKSRGRVQEETTWRAWLVYDEVEPWMNSQGVYSIFWWNSARKVSAEFGFPKVNETVLKVIFTKQQKEINNYIREEIRKPDSVVQETIIPDVSVNEEWRNYGFMGKLKFYYDHNGLKQTIRYAGKKMFKK